MSERDGTNLEKAKISAAAALIIIVTVIGGMWALIQTIPSKKDVEVSDAFSTRIVTWVKESLAGVKADALSQEARLQAQIDHNKADAVEVNRQILNRLDTLGSDNREIRNDVKHILEILPRRSAGGMVFYRPVGM